MSEGLVTIRMVTHTNSRRCSYTKARWEYLILPILEQYPLERKMYEIDLLREYSGIIPREQAMRLRLELNQATHRLDRNASYGWEYKES